MSLRNCSRWLLLASGVALAAAAATWFLPSVDRWVSGMFAGFGVAGLFGAALAQYLPDPAHTGTRALNRRYLREFLPAMAGYVLALLLSVWLLKQVEAPALRALVALLPVPPIALAVRAVVRYIRDADELQRRIELEAVCIATALVSLGYLAAGFLQSAKVVDIDAAAAMIWVFPLTCASYGLAKVAVSRRYQ